MAPEPSQFVERLNTLLLNTRLSSADSDDSEYESATETELSISGKPVPEIFIVFMFLCSPASPRCV